MNNNEPKPKHLNPKSNKGQIVRDSSYTNMPKTPGSTRTKLLTNLLRKKPIIPSQLGKPAGIIITFNIDGAAPIISKKVEIDKLNILEKVGKTNYFITNYVSHKQKIKSRNDFTDLELSKTKNTILSKSVLKQFKIPSKEKQNQLEFGSKKTSTSTNCNSYLNLNNNNNAKHPDYACNIIDNLIKDLTSLKDYVQNKETQQPKPTTITTLLTNNNININSTSSLLNLGKSSKPIELENQPILLKNDTVLSKVRYEETNDNLDITNYQDINDCSSNLFNKRIKNIEKNSVMSKTNQTYFSNNKIQMQIVHKKEHSNTLFIVNKDNEDKLHQMPDLLINADFVD